MITEDKATEIFCMADDFCKLFDAITAKYTLKPTGKRKYHRSSTMSKAEVMLIMILFHTSGYRCFKHFYLEKVCKHLRIFTKLKSNMKGALMNVSDRLLLRKRAIIETVNDELKNIAQVEYSRHRCFDNFIVNLLGAIAAYCLFPKKPCINYKGPLTHSLHCSEFVELTLFSTVRIRMNYQLNLMQQRSVTQLIMVVKDGAV